MAGVPSLPERHDTYVAGWAAAPSPDVGADAPVIRDSLHHSMTYVGVQLCSECHISSDSGAGF